MTTLDELRDVLDALADEADASAPDPSVAYRRASEAASARGRGRPLMFVAAAVVLMAGAVGLFSLLTDDEEGATRTVDQPDAPEGENESVGTVEPEPQPEPEPELAGVGPSNTAESGAVLGLTDQVERFDVGQLLYRSMTAHAGSIWVPVAGGTVLRLDAETGEVLATIAMGQFGDGSSAFPGPDAAHDGRTAFPRQHAAHDDLFGINERGLFRIDPDLNEVTDLREYTAEAPVWASGVGQDAVWLMVSGAPSGWRLERIDPDTGSLVATISLPYSFVGTSSGVPIVVEDDSVWVSVSDFVVRIDPATNTVVAVVETGPAPKVTIVPDLIAADDAIWLINSDLIYRIDPITNTVVAEVRPEAGTQNLCCRAVAVADWLLLSHVDGNIYRLDTTTNSIDAIFSLGAGGFGFNDLVVVDDWLWFSDERHTAASQSSSIGRVPLTAVTA